MCVILVAAGKHRPSEEMVEAAWWVNDNGAGIAFREQDRKTKRSVVHWIKGIMDQKEIQKLVKEAPLPLIAHFRISTAGGRLPSLTHPFPFSDDATLDLEGTTTQPVLFHNGHYGYWKEELFKMSSMSGGKIQIPPGPWSDTRAMAYMAHKLGPGMLTMFDEKFAIITPETMDIMGKTEYMWKCIEGIHCSNDHFVTRMNRQGWHRVEDAKKRDEKKSPSQTQTKTQTEKGGTSSCEPGAEVAGEGAPFRHGQQENQLVQEPTPPTGLSKKALRRWRRRMAKRGLLPKGPERHAKRQKAKYREREALAEMTDTIH